MCCGFGEFVAHHERPQFIYVWLEADTEKIRQLNSHSLGADFSTFVMDDRLSVGAWVWVDPLLQYDVVYRSKTQAVSSFIGRNAAKEMSIWMFVRCLRVQVDSFIFRIDKYCANGAINAYTGGEKWYTHQMKIKKKKTNPSRLIV